MLDHLPAHLTLRRCSSEPLQSTFAPSKNVTSSCELDLPACVPTLKHMLSLPYNEHLSKEQDLIVEIVDNVNETCCSEILAAISADGELKLAGTRDPDLVEGEESTLEEDVPPAEDWCMVCYQPSAVDSVPQPCCNQRVCEDCLQKHILYLVSQGQVENMTCPNWECGSAYSRDDLEQIVSSDVVEKAVRIKKSKTAKRFCPDPACAEPIDNEVKSTVISCTACEKSYCMRCKNPSHGRRPCLPKVDLSPSAIATSIRTYGMKKCPSCKILVRKNGGCYHMTCRNCSHEYMWCCMQPYNNHNRAKCPFKTFAVSVKRFSGPKLFQPVTVPVATGLVAATGAVGVGCAAVGGAGLGVYYGCKTIKKRIKRRARNRRQRKLNERLARAARQIADLDDL